MNQRNIASHHPGAYNSKLWSHYREIEKMVKDGKTWPAIARVLQNKYKLRHHSSTIRNFWFRDQTRTKPLPYRLRTTVEDRPTAKVKLKRVERQEDKQTPLEVI